MASLPPVPPTLDPLRSAATINALVREYNRTDRKAPIVGTDTGTGSAYAIAPVPGIVQYEVGQEFEFQAVHANTTTAPTLAVNGLAAGTITDLAGSPLVVGDIAANSWVRVVCTSTTPAFALLSIQPASFMRKPLSTLTASLGAPVALNNVNTYFTGPSVAQGTSGIWLATGTVSVIDTSAAAFMIASLTDGTNTPARCNASTAAANFHLSMSLSGIFTNPPGNIRINVRDFTSANGQIEANADSINVASTLTVVRIG